MRNIDDQIAKAEERSKKAEERVKYLKNKKMLQDAKNAILENDSLKVEVDSLKQQLKTKEAESLSNAREYQTVMNQVKKLFDDLHGNKFLITNVRINQQGNNIDVVALNPIDERLKKIINLQK